MRRVPKLVLSALVALSVALGVAPATALAAELPVESADGFQQKITDAQNSDVLVLKNNITFNTTLQFNTGKALTLDLNGYQATYNGDSTYALELSGGANLTIIDNGAEGGRSACRRKTRNQGGWRHNKNCWHGCLPYS